MKIRVKIKKMGERRKKINKKTNGYGYRTNYQGTIPGTSH